MKKFKTTFVVALMLMSTFVSVQPLYAETRTHEDCNLIAKERSEILDIEQEAEKDKQERYLGEFIVTAYCNGSCCCGKWSGSPCKNGEYPQQGITVACDTNVIPLNSNIENEGYGIRKCQDTGSKIKNFRLDLYFSSHQEALKFGKKTLKVYKAKDLVIENDL